MVVLLYWQVVSYLKTTFFLYWLNKKYNKTKHISEDSDDAAKWHLEYGYFPFMCSPENSFSYAYTWKITFKSWIFDNIIYSQASIGVMSKKNNVNISSPRFSPDTDSTMYWSWICMLHCGQTQSKQHCSVLYFVTEKRKWRQKLSLGFRLSQAKYLSFKHHFINLIFTNFNVIFFITDTREQVEHVDTERQMGKNGAHNKYWLVWERGVRDRGDAWERLG